MLFLQHRFRNTKQADLWAPECSEIREQHFWHKTNVSNVSKFQETLFFNTNA